MKKITLFAAVLLSTTVTSAAIAQVSAPEIDATSGISAMTVLIGVLAWVSERRRAR